MLIKQLANKLDANYINEGKTKLLALYGQPGFVELTISRIQEQRQIEIRLKEEEDEKIKILQQNYGTGRLKLFGRRRR